MIKVMIWEACSAHCCLWQAVSQHIENNAQSGEAITSQRQQPQDTESDWSKERAESDKYIRVVDGEDGGDKRRDSDREHGAKDNVKRLDKAGWSTERQRGKTWNSKHVVFAVFCPCESQFVADLFPHWRNRESRQTFPTPTSAGWLQLWHVGAASIQKIIRETWGFAICVSRHVLRYFTVATQQIHWKDTVAKGWIQIDLAHSWALPGYQTSAYTHPDSYSDENQTLHT